MLQCNGATYEKECVTHSSRNFLDFVVEVYSLKSTNVKGLRSFNDLVNLTRQWSLYTEQPVPDLAESVHFISCIKNAFAAELNAKMTKTL